MKRRLSGGPGLLALALAGALHALAFAPLPLWWLQVLCLSGLAWAVQRAPTVGAAAWRGWAFGFGWLTAGLWWLFISMHDYGHLPAPLAALAVAVLAAFLSLYLAGAMALAARWRQAAPALAGLVFAACWLLGELARGRWFTGFPWIASGYAHADGPLAGWAPYIGVYGIGALAAACAWGVAGLLQGRWRAALLPGALAAAGLALPQDFSAHHGAPLGVSLLQTNVAQDLKFDADRMNGTIARLAAQVSAARGPLVVTPESAIPLPNLLLDEAGWASFHGPVARSGQPGRSLLVGLFLGSDEAGWVNSLAGLKADSRPHDFYRYGKRHLLPFGEFIPPGFGWLVALMNIPIGDQAQGRSTAPMDVAGQRLRPLICYEDLFGEDIAAGVVGPQGATVLVNSSNLAWFGRHQVQEQHLQFSRLRALEFQRPVIRATNTGATAIVDHRGVVTQQLPPLVEATLDGTVQGRSGDTPYARWLAAAGLWPLWALALGLLAGLWRRVGP
ncbi:apolipoprotein N-acyltransferase [Burkholderiales bacterium JOSHI_001]|nr:apolipoprotein N-acyltransferase [Burkholderiales bacterium JOSHI_001]